MTESNGDGWHEAPSVAIARMVCQLIVTVTVLCAAMFLVLTRPEYNAGVALVCGVVLTAYYTVPGGLTWGGRHRRRKDAEED